MSRYWVGNNRSHSTMGITERYIVGEENEWKIDDLYSYYHPFEVDPSLSREQRKFYMDEW